MKRCSLVGALGAVVAVCAVAPASAGAGQRIPTTITFDHISPHSFAPARTTTRGGPDGYDFVGHVDSPRPKCRRARKISLYRMRPGPDLRLGYGFSDSNSGWAIFVPSADYGAATYYAKAARLKLRNGSVCRADRTSDIVPT